ncbi:DUF418 domain-containing protein YeiB [Limnobaculum parvum]|uniref:DUF418 domain-containing protein YeiB n=1 Tax=Limnobaculum parvum TaxID=2172103 RepID=UPI002E768EA4|nr:DUF418 domain-containing protein YeiB [Limnobaculum parvum]
MQHNENLSVQNNGKVLIPSRRFEQLDSARGLALLGILVMNIGGFGLPKSAYMNPAYLGMPSFSDGLVWSLLSTFVQGTFLAMFAMLFGAGLQLLSKRSAGWNTSRLFWLALLGFCHSVYLWDGDILLTYGLVGLGSMVIIRTTSTSRSLMRTGILLYIIGLAIMLWLGFQPGSGFSDDWTPSPNTLNYETTWKLDGGELAHAVRLEMTLMTQFSVIFQYGWELTGLMLIGAALLHNGWLLGNASLIDYRRQGWILFTLSLLIHIPAMLMQWWTKWDFIIAGYYLQVPKELAATLQGLAYLALWYGYGQSINMSKANAVLSRIGRMTLSNYLLQTLICTTLFYHYGWYRHFDRLELLAMVPVIWCVNILFSLLWLKYFKQGPIEWLWRRLTSLVAVE